jgi:predicted nucleotidyltransferase
VRVSASESVATRILRVAACHGAGNVRLFGSLVADLEQLLGRRAQVVIRRSLSPLIGDSVLREAVPL